MNEGRQQGCEEADRILSELQIVITALHCSVRKTVTRLQHEQMSASFISQYTAEFEQHEASRAQLEAALRAALSTMQELSGKITAALDQG